jgi:hypothetical protein
VLWWRRPTRCVILEGWVISKHPAHPALVSEADFITPQDATVPRGPVGPAARQYLLAGLLACARCGRRLESTGSNGRPAYRCGHGYTSAAGTDPAGPGTPMSVRTRSCRPWRPSPACSLATARPSAAAPRRSPPPQDRGPHRPAQSFRSRAHLRPADPDDPRQRQRPGRRHRRPEPLTPPQQQPGERGGVEPDEAPATAEGQARVTISYRMPDDVAACPATRYPG